MGNDYIVNEFVKDRLLVYLQKNKDYGDSVLKSILKFGEVAVLVRIGDKVNRLEQLLATKDIKVKDESIEDTLLDLFNYILLLRAYNLDGARIIISDLASAMFKEVENILYGNKESTYIYYVLNELLQVEDKFIWDIFSLLISQIKRY